MIHWYIRSHELVSDLKQKAVDALRQCDQGQDSTASIIARYMQADFENLKTHWHSRFPSDSFGSLGRHIGFGKKCDFKDIVATDLPEVEAQLFKRLKEYIEGLPREKDGSYVSEARLKQLLKVSKDDFDLSRLIKLLREINAAHQRDCYLTIGVLLRSIIDHVPPVFKCDTFSQVANNYPGTKSFKKSMEHLEVSLRNLSDSYLHTQIRRKETLPSFQQVDFRADLDALLSEIARILD